MPCKPGSRFLSYAPGLGDWSQTNPPTVEVLEEPAALTTAGLADQVHEICISDKAVFYPNNIDTALDERDYNFIASNTTLVILKSFVGATPTRFSQEVLSKLKHKTSIKNVHFYPPTTDIEKHRPFDFKLFSKQLQVHLPNVEVLYLRHMRVINFMIESTSIKTLRLQCPNMLDGEWELKCPNLEDLYFANHSPPAKNFAQALINCPRIKRYYSHKYKNEDPFPPLFLPNCQRFIFRRGENTKTMKIFLPRVEELTLDACYDMPTFEFLKEGHPSHAQWNISLDMVPGTSFKLSLKNAGLSESAISNLRKSGRVLNPRALEQELDPNQGPDDMAKAPGYRDPGMNQWMQSISRTLQRESSGESSGSDDDSSGDEVMKALKMDRLNSQKQKADDDASQKPEKKPEGPSFEDIVRTLDRLKSEKQVKPTSSKSPETPRKSPNLRNGSPAEKRETRTSKATEVPKTRPVPPKKSETQTKPQKLGVSWAAAGFLNKKPAVASKKPLAAAGNKKRDVSTKATIDKEVGTGGDGSRSQRAKKNKKKSVKRNTTSLSKFGVTKSKKELRTLEWDWLYGFNTKLEKGHELTLQHTLSTFPLNKLFYQTPAGSQTLISKHSKRPTFTSSNLALIKLLHESGFQFMPKKIKPSSSDEKVQPSGQNTKKVSSALTSNGYSNYMQTIILKDVKAQANKIKRDAKKLKEVRALEKANAEKEKARQRKIKEKQEAQKKKIEECRRKYETELHAVVTNACECDCFCGLGADMAMSGCQCPTESGADPNVDNIQRAITESFLKMMAEIKRETSDASDSD